MAFFGGNTHTLTPMYKMESEQGSTGWPSDRMQTAQQEDED